MSYFDDASLVMIPSGYKTSKVYSVKPTDGTGDLTFTRSNDTATRVNSSGLVEKVRENLILQSNTLSNASWIKTNLTVTGGQTGYDGSSNAWLYTEGTFTASLPDLNSSFSTSTNIETYSFYAKAGTKNWIIISIGLAGYTFVNLSDGSIGSSFGSYPLSVTTESLSGGWYRVKAVSPTGSKNSFSVHLTTADTVTSYNGNGTGTIYIQNFQRETGDIATSYIATTSAAVSVGPVANVPRLDYLNSSCPRLLLEPQRTSLVTFSESFNNAAWGDAGITITANQAVSPDGYTNADLAVNASSVNYLYQGLGSPFSGTYTVSIFAKKGSQSSFAFGMVAGGFTGGMGVKFNFDTQTFSTPTNYGNFTSISASYQSYGNGWYRLNLTGTTATSTTYFFVLGSLQESFAVNAYVYGAQVEAGAYATSYIPTLGAAVTRGADACSKTGISSLIGQTEGTIFAEINFDLGVTAQGDSRIQLSDGTTSNWIFMGLPDGASSNLIRMYVNAPSGSVSAYSSSPIVNGVNKIAFGYKSGSFVLYVNGVQAATSSTTLTMATCSRIDLQGSVPAASTSERENIKQVLLFKTRLTNAQLAELTTL